MRKYSEEFEEEFGTAPSQDELAELLGVSKDTLQAIVRSAVTPLSIDSSARYSGSSGPSEGRTLGEMIPDDNAPDPAAAIDQEKIGELVRNALGTLTEREEKIIRLRFGISEDPTDQERFPISNSEVRRLSTLSKEESSNEYA